MDGKANAGADGRFPAAGDGKGEVKPSKGNEFPADPVSSNVPGRSTKEEPEPGYECMTHFTEMQDPAKAQEKKDKVKSALIITGVVAAVVAVVVAVARNRRKT
ncbi:hypothetical protein ACLOJK_005847 [Asimina triloba]